MSTPRPFKPRAPYDQMRRFTGMPKINSLPCPLHPGMVPYASILFNGNRCPECQRIARRARYAAKGESGGSKYATARASAERKGWDFTITRTEFEEIIARPCVYQYNGPPASSTGIDRIDSTKGYVSGNCQPCCGKHNQFKSDVLTHDQMQDAVQRYNILCGNNGAGRKRIDK
jgi:hypothetical protein